MTVIRIPWKTGDTVSAWDEVCVWAIEQFGLPGKRYICKPTADYMDFHFNNEQDAVFFSLRWTGNVHAKTT